MTNEASLIPRKRLKDCNHGEVIQHVGTVYKVRKQRMIRIIPKNERGFFRLTSAVLEFGLKCQMRVEIKTTTDEVVAR